MNNGKLPLDFGSETRASLYHLLMHHPIQLGFKKFPQLELKSTVPNLYCRQTKQKMTHKLLNSDFRIFYSREKTFLGEKENLAEKNDLTDLVPNQFLYSF